MSAKKKAPKKKTPSKKASPTKKPKELVDQKLIKGLSHPLRVRILTLLCDAPSSPRKLSDELAEGLSKVSYHVKVLKDDGLIELVGTAPRRGAVEHFYRPTYPLIIPDGLWSRFPKSARRRIWADVLQDIDDDVTRSVKEDTFDSRDDFHVSFTPMQLDEEGWRELAASTDQFMEDVLQIQAKSSKRQVEEKQSKGIPASAVVLVFESARGPSESKKASARKRG